MAKFSVNAADPNEPPRLIVVEAKDEQDAWNQAKLQDISTGHATEPSLKGALDSVARGMAPTLAGGAMGAAIGGIPTVGIGAPAGFGAGVATTALEEVGGSAYNAIAPHVGLPHFTTFGETINKGLDKYGTARPQAPVERGLEAAAGGATGAAGLAKGLEMYGAKMAPSVTRGVIRNMSQQPVRQGVSGALAGGTMQGLQDAGLGPVATNAAGFASGLLPFFDRGSGALPQTRNAIDRGYTIPPALAAKNPSWTSDIIGSIGNQATQTRDATFANQEVNNSFIRKELNIPENVKISNQALDEVIQDKGRVYGEVEKLPGDAVDPEYDKAVSAIKGPLAALSEKFPVIAKNDNLIEVVADLQKQDISSEEAVGLSRMLRQKASKNIMNKDPEIAELGHAQKDAAEAVESLLERRMIRAGNTKLADRWRDARTKIAQAHYVKGALNEATGNVDAKKLGSVDSKGKGGFTGGIGKAASTANAFPSVSGTPEKAGLPMKADPRALIYSLPMGAAPFVYHYTDSLPMAAGLAGVGGASMVAPKLARALALSKTYQKAIRNSPPEDKAGDYAKSAAALLQAYPYINRPNQ